MTHRLESLKTPSRSVFYFQRASRWGCTQVYGTQTIGQLEAVWLKQIGPRLHSLLLTGTLRLMVVLIPTEDRLVPQRNQPLIGTLKKWIRLAKLDSDGFRRITWSIITVRILRGFRRESLGNVQQDHRSFKRDHIHLIYLSSSAFFRFICKALCFFFSYLCVDSFDCVNLGPITAN